ncbi:hypothetical protein R0K05_24215, partial [Planococcus sp. SIMBA_160]
LERRGLIVGLYVACAAGLLVSAMSGSFPVLLLGTLVTGLCSVSAQVLVPYAATLAAPQERARVRAGQHVLHAQHIQHRDA